MGLQALYYHLTHGVPGFITLYVLIATFQFAGMRRGWATLDQCIFWPFTALATLVVVGFSLSVVVWLLSATVGLRFKGIGENFIAVVVIMGGGYLGGLYWSARGRSLAAAPRRGAIVHDGGDAQIATQQMRKEALAKPDIDFPVTVAGVAIPFEDELKHFKLMGTTGSGKTSSLRELVHAALYRGDRAVIADPDGGYLSRFYDPKRGDVILNPFDARMAKWDLFAELRNAYEVDPVILRRHAPRFRFGIPIYCGRRRISRFSMEYLRSNLGCLCSAGKGAKDERSLYRRY